MLNDNTLGTYNIADLRELARRRLPKAIFEFIDRGNEDEVALRNNGAALERIKLKPRLFDVSILRDEIDRVLALIGCPGVAALNPNYVVLPRSSFYGEQKQ
jgi:isopentenyl diphosphate isomerase/L-lactate dehydrogenase-like FMN-dependent dehydrogenase